MFNHLGLEKSDTTDIFDFIFAFPADQNNMGTHKSS